MGWIVGLLGLGCMPTVGSADARPEVAAEVLPRTRATPAAAPPGGSFEVEVDGRAALAPEPALALPRGAGHAEHAGWSPDGERFGYCHARSDDCYECRTVARDGTAESIESGPGCAEGIPRERLDAHLVAEPPGPGASRWRWGSEVVIVVESREQEQTNAGQPRPMLKVGARLREGGPAAWMLHVDPCEGCGIDQVCTGGAHLDALGLSPDGREVVALVHGRGNDGSSQLRVERLRAERLRAAARTPASRATP